ncbi:hypothetical protein PFISCL1PPCAC_8358 [Pristionchus fissidentatus]|uniref:Uncharacterized protein n=1 Tax=Pristionchus fissidentatus TaxID=1538716 RepID=A0AAV5VEC3_9BILA|nr:hypothetical protein PFISCL1PPCAC_8358 [Pristionchus fissidentatus]
MCHSDSTAVAGPTKSSGGMEENVVMESPWDLGWQIPQWMEVPVYELPRWEVVHTIIGNTLCTIDRHMKTSLAQLLRMHLPDLRDPPPRFYSEAIYDNHQEGQSAEDELRRIFDRQSAYVSALKECVEEMGARGFGSHYPKEQSLLNADLLLVKRALRTVDWMLMHSDQVVDKPSAEECREADVAEAMRKSDEAEERFRLEYAMLKKKHKRLLCNSTEINSEEEDCHMEWKMSDKDWMTSQPNNFFRPIRKEKQNIWGAEGILKSSLDDSCLSRTAETKHFSNFIQSSFDSFLEINIPGDSSAMNDSSSNCSTSRESSPLSMAEIVDETALMKRQQFHREMRALYESDSPTANKGCDTPPTPAMGCDRKYSQSIDVKPPERENERVQRLYAEGKMCELQQSKVNQSMKDEGIASDTKEENVVSESRMDQCAEREAKIQSRHEILMKLHVANERRRSETRIEQIQLCECEFEAEKLQKEMKEEEERSTIREKEKKEREERERLEKENEDRKRLEQKRAREEEDRARKEKENEEARIKQMKKDNAEQLERQNRIQREALNDQKKRQHEEMRKNKEFEAKLKQKRKNEEKRTEKEVHDIEISLKESQQAESKRRAAQRAEDAEERRKENQRKNEIALEKAKDIKARQSLSIDEIVEKYEADNKWKMQNLEATVEAQCTPTLFFHKDETEKKNTKSASNKKKHRHNSVMSSNGSETSADTVPDREEVEEEKKTKETVQTKDEIEFQVALSRKSKRKAGEEGTKIRFEKKIFVEEVPMFEDKKTAATHQAFNQKAAAEARQKEAMESRESTPPQHKPSSATAKIKYKKEKSNLIDGLSPEYYEEMRAKKEKEAWWINGLDVVKQITVLVCFILLCINGTRFLPFHKNKPNQQSSQVAQPLSCGSDDFSYTFTDHIQTRSDHDFGNLMSAFHDPGVPQALKIISEDSRPRLECFAWLGKPLDSPVLCVNDTQSHFDFIHDAANVDITDQESGDLFYIYKHCIPTVDVTDVVNGVPVWWNGMALNLEKSSFYKHDAEAAYDLIESEIMESCYRNRCLQRKKIIDEDSGRLNAAHCYQFLKVATRLMRIASSGWGLDRLMDKDFTWMQLLYPLKNVTADDRLQYEHTAVVDLLGVVYDVVYSADIPLPLHPVQFSKNRTQEHTIVDYYEVRTNGTKRERNHRGVGSFYYGSRQFDKKKARSFKKAVKRVASNEIGIETSQSSVISHPRESETFQKISSMSLPQPDVA